MAGSAVVTTRKKQSNEPIRSFRRLPSAKRFSSRATRVAWQASVYWREVIRWTLDAAIASLLLLATSPIWFVAAIGMLLTGKQLVRLERLGRNCNRFDELRFPIAENRVGKLFQYACFDHLPVLINILRGEMGIVGPRPLSPLEANLTDKLARRRLSDMPGLISLWWLRRRANIAYESELSTDLEYIESRSILGDLGILFRASLTSLYGAAKRADKENIQVLGIRIRNVTMREAIEHIFTKLDENDPYQVCFVNADCANIACRNPGYKLLLNQCDYTLGDGIGVKLAGRILKQDIRENVNGTDLFPRLCARLEGTGKRIFLLGARPGIPELVRDWALARYPNLQFAGTQHGYFSKAEEGKVIERIRESKADIILVAFGAPRQDLWVRENLAATGCKVGIGVGGLFDYYSGRIPRAPQWVRELCLEWFYRFYQEPKRLWKRYFLGNGVFLARVFLQKFGARY